ncbi:MAG: hypothetical protein ACRD59_05635 [Candidatus Acidiferrales bacterium]
MDMDINYPDSYRVEVSGWDAKENFFVEKTILDWKPEDKKVIALRVPIRVGAIVFVRLLQPASNGSNFPIAYEALASSAKDEQGAAHISLERLRPRATNRETFAADHLLVEVA